MITMSIVGFAIYQKVGQSDMSSASMRHEYLRRGVRQLHADEAIRLAATWWQGATWRGHVATAMGQLDD
jgi:hypothetical protein